MIDAIVPLQVSMSDHLESVSDCRACTWRLTDARSVERWMADGALGRTSAVDGSAATLAASAQRATVLSDARYEDVGVVRGDDVALA